MAQTVVTKVTGSVTEPTVHATVGVAAKLFGPGGWLHVVVIQSGAVPGVDAGHDATGADVLFAAGRVQMKTK